MALFLLDFVYCPMAHDSLWSCQMFCHPEGFQKGLHRNRATANVFLGGLAGVLESMIEAQDANAHIRASNKPVACTHTSSQARQVASHASLRAILIHSVHVGTWNTLPTSCKEIHRRHNSTRTCDRMRCSKQTMARHPGSSSSIERCSWWRAKILQVATTLVYIGVCFRALTAAVHRHATTPHMLHFWPVLILDMFFSPAYLRQAARV